MISNNARDLYDAYTASISEVKGDHTNVQAWQRLGVLASELGLACWFRLHKNTAASFWRQAALCFNKATTLLLANRQLVFLPPEEKLLWCAIICNNLLNTARMTMIDGNSKVLKKAIQDLRSLLSDIEELPNKSARLHQQGIAYGVLAFMQSGSIFGLPGEPENEREINFEKSTLHFEAAQETSEKMKLPKIMRDFRNMLLLWAIATLNHPKKQRLLGEVIRSAQISKDPDHESRARRIARFGTLGDRLISFVTCVCPTGPLEVQFVPQKPYARS